MILLADLGATNARFSVTEDCNTFRFDATYPIDNFHSIESLCLAYFEDQNLDKVERAIIGVAAPIIGDSVSFVNTDMRFSIEQLKKNLFPKGLFVLNDLALQAHAIIDLNSNALSYIGEGKISEGPKILVSPGTGLGLAGIVGQEVIATEAGHINIPFKNLGSDLTIMITRFIEENRRSPTYEDFLSGKGIIYFHSVLAGYQDPNLTSEEILSDRKDKYCRSTIDLLNNLLASYLRYVTLVWGSYGGVLLSGSITESLLLQEDYEEFRREFEDSETMGNFMKKIPLAILRIPDIGFTGGLRIAKTYMK